jgi:cell division septation protein DedD
MRKNGLRSRPLTPKKKFFYQPIQTPLPDPVPMKFFFRWGFAAVIGIWMFFLGVIVGRQIPPVTFDINPIENEVNRLRIAEMEKEEVLLKEGVAALDKTDLEFYDALRDSRPALKGTPPIVAARAPVPAPAPAALVPLEKETKPSRAAPEPKKPVIEPPHAAAVSPANASNFAIQVASFALMDEADRMVGSLRQRGYPGAYRSDEVVPGVGVRYRVKVGYFQDRTTAQGTLARLQTREQLPDAYIFQKK